MFFLSDNAAPVAPQVMEALMRANQGFAAPYGNDEVTARVRATIREVFEAPEAAIYFVATGTSANVLALASITPPWGAIFCHDDAHVHHDECNAPEFFTQAKLIPVTGEQGRITPEGLQAAIARKGAGVVHSAQPAALTLTNVTEDGTLYTPAQIAALTTVAREHKMLTHLDGARFANAVAALGCSPAEMTWKAGVDVVSFGGTKGGLMGAEAVVFFDPKHAWEFELRRKRGGHLFSKLRYLSAQFEGWLEGGLWLEMARHANAMTARLAEGLGQIEGVTFAYEVGGNIIFADFPEVVNQRLQAAGARYYLNGSRARLVTSWATSVEEVEAFIAAAKG